MRQGGGGIRQAEPLSGVQGDNRNTSGCSQYSSGGKRLFGELYQHRQRAVQEVLSQWEEVSLVGGGDGLG